MIIMVLFFLPITAPTEPRQPYRKTARPYWRQNLCALEVYIYIYIYIGFTYRPAYWSSKRSTQGGRQRAWRVSKKTLEEALEK